MVPCPVRDGELDHKKQAARRKSRMDQRTRERLPVLPALAAAAEAGRAAAATRLAAARAASPGQRFTVGGQTLIRPRLAREVGSRTWADDPATGRRRDLQAEERRAFWSWAAVEVLRLTGIRIEELSELSHHSLIQYRLPATGELVPLLQIASSKTDTERLLVISPELADVLSAIITRIRDADGSVPPVAAYDYGEKTWNPPMPLLFQWRCGLENRPFSAGAIRKFVNITLAATGLTGTAGQPLRFTPHDFRRLFLTDAVMHGMPPHIAQLVAGHRDINVTMGYKAVYPEEVINGHRAFIARRRALRPSEEYRTPSDAEWEEFLGHFERRKVALGDCGRAYGTSCIHEHSCLTEMILKTCDVSPPATWMRRVTKRFDAPRFPGRVGAAVGLRGRPSSVPSRQGVGHGVSDQLLMGAEPLHLGQHAQARAPGQHPLGEHLKTAAPQEHRDRCRVVPGQRSHGRVTADEALDTRHVQPGRLIVWPAAAPQAVADVGQGRFQVGQREVDDATRPGRLPGCEHIVVGEVAVDDQPRQAAMTDAFEVGGEFPGQAADQACLVVVLPRRCPAGPRPARRAPAPAEARRGAGWSPVPGRRRRDSGPAGHRSPPSAAGQPAPPRPRG